jgi:hypothetical protein
MVPLILVVILIGVAITVASMLPVRHAESPPFASPAFQRAWVSEVSAATRSIDLWGSEPLAWRVEPYAGAPNDRRIVQYFDRGRMEVESGSNRVTLGSLAHEMTTGRIDFGEGVSLERQPLDLPIDSGEPDAQVPTYLTLGRIVGEDASDRSATNERITEWIEQSGPVDRSATPEVRRFGEYIEATGHNLPDVTVELFERPEFQDQRWVEQFGYPISEPHWAEYRRGESMMPSLIQVFERRILVYTPGLESSQAFTIPSTGRHYSVWRYGSEPHPEAIEPPEDALDPGLVLGEKLEAWVYAEDIGTPIDLTLSPTGHLMILTAEGQILKAASVDPDRSVSEFTVWADGIEEPQGMVTRGGSVLVTASDRVMWFHDQDGVAVSGESSDLEAVSSVQAAIRGKPVSNSAGSVFARTDSNGSGDVLREVGSNEPIVRLDSHISEPGAIEFARGDLLMSGVSDDGRTSVLLLPSVNRDFRPSRPVKIATFPRGSLVRAMSLADEEKWEISELGDVIVAVQNEDGASLYALSRENGVEETELIELVSGLSRPTALEVGLDGSIYVADAEQGTIVRIQYRA